MNKEKEVLLGQFGVDSGQVVIIDPCYINSEWKKETGKGNFGGGTYAKCCRLTLGKKQGGTLRYRLGHKGLGVVSTTGFGDGFYNVYAIFSDEGDWGKRIKELRIKFF